MASISSMRRKILVLLLVCSLIVLALSAHVNAFMGFFYIADRFPFIMSLLTVVIVGALLVIEFMNSGAANYMRPTTELPLLAVLLVTWTGANAFSTDRWRNVQPKDCAAIPVEQAPEFYGAARTWCQEIQVLRAFIWFEWVIVGISMIATFVFCIYKARKGISNVWNTPFSCFDHPDAPSAAWKDHYLSDEKVTDRRKRNHTSAMSGPMCAGSDDPFNVTSQDTTHSQDTDEPYVLPTTWQSFADGEHQDHGKIPQNRGYADYIADYDNYGPTQFRNY